jgi:hypothetical protein
MEKWMLMVEECEDLLRQYEAAKTEGLRVVLLRMAASKFSQALALKRASK